MTPLTDELKAHSTVPRYHQAYTRHLPAILAVEDKELIPITLDLYKVLTNTLGTLPQVFALSDELRALDQFDVTALDKLEGYVLAMAHAHGLHTFSTQKNRQSVPAEQAAELRSVLLADAKALVARELITGASFDQLRGRRGVRSVAFDLIALAGLLRENWIKIRGRTALRLEELDHAEALADQLLRGVGRRGRRSPEVAKAAAIRQRAFTLFARTYAEVRRGVHFLRWHEGDADEIAPSLYAGRRRRDAPREDMASAAASTELAPQRLPEGRLAVARLPPAELPPDLPIAPERGLAPGPLNQDPDPAR